MDVDKWYSNVSLSHDRACTRLEFVNEWFFRADAAGALPGAARRVAASLPGPAAIASGATDPAAIPPSSGNSHRYRYESRGLATREICGDAQVAVRGIPLGHAAPAPEIP